MVSFRRLFLFKKIFLAFRFFLEVRGSSREVNEGKGVFVLGRVFFVFLKVKFFLFNFLGS